MHQLYCAIVTDFWEDASSTFVVGAFENICFEDVTPGSLISEEGNSSISGPRKISAYEVTGVLCVDQVCEEATVIVGGSEGGDEPILSLGSDLSTEGNREKLLLRIAQFETKAWMSTRDSQNSFIREVWDEALHHCGVELDFAGRGIGMIGYVVDDEEVCFDRFDNPNPNGNGVGPCFPKQEVLSTRPEWAAITQFPSE
ncbi:MAG: hypothetical protein GY822_08800 [Deltaproteobacteria bacterium]|nr:hypothetical protein [Deltaproteobacteria bacterium]